MTVIFLVVITHAV